MSAARSEPIRDQPLSYGDFIGYLERELGTELLETGGDLVIGVDFEMDSVTMLEMVVAIEDIGAELPADLFLTAKTLGEVYSEYLRAAGFDGKNADAGPPGRT
jgi:acyl carrier protein